MSAARERIADDDAHMLFWDGFDAALVGTGERCGQPNVAVYDYDKCVAVLMRDGASLEDAQDYIGHNMTGGWLGAHTPLMVHRPPR
jgi:hypothetical protein